MSDETTSFDDRLKRARSGDQSALNKLMGENRSFLRGLAARALGPKLRRWHDASDVAQHCLQIACRSLGSFKGQDRATWRAWLRGIHRNLVRKLLRDDLPKAKREQPLLADPRGELPGMAIPAFEVEEPPRQWELLKAAMSWLSEEDRILIEHRFLAADGKQKPFEEIGAQLGASAAELRQRVGRLLSRLEQGIALLQRLDACELAFHYRQVLCWKQFRAWPIARIAQELGCSDKTAAQLLRIAREQLGGGAGPVDR